MESNQDGSKEGETTVDGVKGEGGSTGGRTGRVEGSPVFRPVSIDISIDCPLHSGLATTEMAQTLLHVSLNAMWFVFYETLLNQ